LHDDPFSARGGNAIVNEFAAQHPIAVVALIKVVVLLFLLLTTLAYLVWFERKVSAHIQSRLGPNRVGAYGLLQPMADAIKFLTKEDPTPAGADRFTYYLAPLLSMGLSICAVAVVPFGPGTIHIFGQSTPLVVADVNIGLLVIFALTSLGVYGIVLAGWSSDSKYSLLGGLRSSAQMVSYELSLTLSVVGVLLLAGSFSLTEIITAQSGFTWGFLPRWNFLNPLAPQILGFFCYFVAAVAETNRLPFDLAEAETELVAGFHTEYAAFKFGMFFVGEYAAMFTVACLAVIMFFGGWLSPLPGGANMAWTAYIPPAALAIAGLALFAAGIRYRTIAGKIVLAIMGLGICGLGVLCAGDGVRQLIQGPFWFLLKVFVVLFVYVWVRWTLPRFRYDQLMAIGWKFLLPLSLANVVLTSLLVVARS
jgi:NADH-quinone oxidoreductase subunit H